MDARDSRLLRDGVEVRLRPQALQALKALLKHRGRSVSYEQMIAEAWKGTFVARHTVDVTIGEVRKTLGEYGRWISHRPKVGYCIEVPTSEELVRKGWHFWNRRTREGFDRALECFQQATVECPSDFRAFEGISVSNLMLVAFAIRRPREVYPAFLAAHNQAVELGGLTPELRCNRAHGLHIFERRYDEAEEEFQKTLEEKPTLAPAYVRLALLHATRGRLGEAMEVVERGLRADPLFPTLTLTEAALRFWGREFDLSIAVGAKCIELHPFLQVARVFYAHALEFSGRLDEALAQYQRGSLMFPDLPWLRALEGACLGKMGRTAEGQAILDQLEQLRRSDYVDAYSMAVLRLALGDRDGAFVELARAVEENSAQMYPIHIDPKMDPLRDDARFVRIQELLRQPEPL